MLWRPIRCLKTPDAVDRCNPLWREGGRLGRSWTACCLLMVMILMFGNLMAEPPEATDAEGKETAEPITPAAASEAPTDVRLLEQLLLEGGPLNHSGAVESDVETDVPRDESAPPSLWTLIVNVALFLIVFCGMAWYSARFLRRMATRWSTMGSFSGEKIAIVARHVLGNGQSLLVVRYRGEDHLVAWASHTVTVIRSYRSQDAGVLAESGDVREESPLAESLEAALKTDD